jgi:hypothetical protein
VDSPKDESRIAPFVVLGAMFLIALVGLGVVFVHHCTRDEPYLEPTLMDPRDPHRLDN